MSTHLPRCPPAEVVARKQVGAVVREHLAHGRVRLPRGEHRRRAAAMLQADRRPHVPVHLQVQECQPQPKAQTAELDAALPTEAKHSSAARCAAHVSAESKQQRDDGGAAQSARKWLSCGTRARAGCAYHAVAIVRAALSLSHRGWYCDRTLWCAL